MNRDFFDIRFKSTICDLIDDDDSYNSSRIKLYRKKYLVKENNQTISMKKRLAKDSDNELILPNCLSNYAESLIEFGIRLSLNLKYISNYTFIDLKNAILKYKELILELKSIKNCYDNKISISFFSSKIDFYLNEHDELKSAMEKVIIKELKTINDKYPFLTLSNSDIDTTEAIDDFFSRLNTRYIKKDTNKYLLTHNVIERLKLLIRIDEYLENDEFNSIDDIPLHEFEYNFIYDFLVFFDLMFFTRQNNNSTSRKIDIISTKKFPYYVDIFDENYTLLKIKEGININKSTYKLYKEQLMIDY